MRSLAGKSGLFVAVAGGVLAAVYAWAATHLRVPSMGDPVGPRVVPYLIALGLALSCIAMVVEHVSRRGGTSDTDAKADSGVTTVALVTSGLLAGYFLVFELAGFIVATAIFLLALLSVTNRGRWIANLVIAIVFPVAAYLLLATLLGARLPAGILQLG